MQVAKMLTEPRMYHNFVNELRLLKEQKSIRTAIEHSAQQRSVSTVDHVTKNVEEAKNHSQQQLLRQE